MKALITAGPDIPSLKSFSFGKGDSSNLCTGKCLNPCPSFAILTVNYIFRTSLTHLT